MLKRKRIIALFSSAIILANSTSGAINEFIVFAEDNIAPIVKENLSDSNNESNKQENNSSNAIDNSENGDNLSESVTTTHPDNSGSKDTVLDDSSTTPSSLDPIINGMTHNGAEKDGIYYTNENKISFTFDVVNVDEITLKENNLIWADNNNVDTVNNKATITLNTLVPNETLDATIVFTSINGDSKEFSLKLIMDKTAPVINFKKNTDGSDLDKDKFDKNEVYYLPSNENEEDSFDLFMEINDNAEVNISKLEPSKTNNINDFDVDSSLSENGYYKFNISNIKENKENTLKVTVKDLAGNEATKEFKFFKDTAKAEVTINSNVLNKNKSIYYIERNVKDLELDLNFKNVENINDFSSKDILINDINIPVYDEKNETNELSMILSNIKGNKATLTLKNIPENKDLKLEFKNLKDNEKDTLTSEYKLSKDTIAPNISLQEPSKEEATEVTYKEDDTLYLKYDETSTELTINSDEDVFFSAKLNGNYLSPVDKDKPNVFKVKVNVKPNSTNDFVITATDYSGNKTELNYKIIQDSNDYSDKTKFENLMTTTFADKTFKNNELYVYDQKNNTFSFKFKFSKDDLKDKFAIYNYKNDEKTLLNNLEDNVTLKYNVNGNDFKYTLYAKNGSLSEDNTYKVYYTSKSELNINFLDNGNVLKDKGLYSDANKQFNFNATIADADISNITGVNVNLVYTPFDGRPIKVDNINLSADSKYLKKGFKNILVGKEQRKAKTYTLSKEFILNKLGFTDGRFKDGTYSIEINVDSKFDYKNKGTKEDPTNKTITFSVYSSTPEATLVLKDANNNKLVDLNNEPTYINANDIYIGIKKEKFNINNYENYTRTITINDEEYKFNTLEECGKFEDYILYKPTNETDINKLNLLISDYNMESKKYDFNVEVSDSLENGANINSLNNKYIIDKKKPEFKIYSTNINTNTEINLKGINKKEHAPFVNPENIMAVITNEELNNTIDNTNITHDRFLWFDRSSNINNGLKFDIKSILKIDNEGLYEFKIVSSDKAGNTIKETFCINVDMKKPDIEMRGIHKNNDTVFASLATLNVDINRKPFSFRSFKNMFISDTMNSELTLKLELEEENTKKTYTFDATSNSPQFNIPVVDGIYNVKLTATDKAGNEASNDNGKITIDGAKPVVSTTLSTLKDGNLGEGTHTIEHKNVASVQPVITITDITTKPDHINIALEGRNSSKSIPVNESNSSVSGYTRTITLPAISNEDVYNLKISVGDRIASRNHSVTNIGFGIDRTKPSLSVTAGGKSITEGSTTYLNAKDTKDLVAKVNDNILAENEIKTVITLNGSSKNSTTHTFNSDNTYNVNVTTTDNASNSNSLDFTIIVDTVIPQVTIEGVSEGKFFDKDVTPIITTDDETAVETITLNNQSYTKGTIINKDNDYTLVAKAEDEAGNIGEASVNFVLDKTKPVINIKNIEENVLYTKSTLSSDIKALDYGVEKVIYLDNKTTLIPDIEVSDNDNEVEKVIFLDNKEYTGGPISTDGSHVLTVKAVDRASNTSQATVKFKTNLNPPTITIHGIENNKTYTGPVKLNIEFGDTKLYHILINGKEYMNGDIISKPGKYKMEIIAIDEFNSESRQVINFTINEGVVAPSSVKDSGPTANTYKLVAVGVVTTLSLILFGVFFKVLRPKNISE